MSNDTEKEIKAIWKAIGTINKGMEEVSNDIDKFVTLIEDKLKMLGFREPKDFVDNSRTIV